jgi:hypothetical protein
MELLPPVGVKTCLPRRAQRKFKYKELEAKPVKIILQPPMHPERKKTTRQQIG